MRARGFTLIEILVVLVIIGLMAGAMVMVGSDNRDAIARDETEKLQAKLKLAIEEAQLHGVEYGLVVTETEYQFVTFGEDRWSPVSDDKAYQRYALPEGFELALEIEGFKLAGARLPGARITEDGEVVSDEEQEKSANLKATQNAKSSSLSGKESDDKDSALPNGAESDAEKSATAKTTEAGDEEESDNAPKLLPQVFLLSSGEVNPFVVAIGNRDDQPVFYRLRTTEFGDIKFEGPIQGDLLSDLTEPWDNPDPEAQAEENAELEAGHNNSNLIGGGRNSDRSSDRTSDRKANRERSNDGK